MSKADRVFPVLVYYAAIARSVLTYGDLAKITGDHHRSFMPAFSLIHNWIEEAAQVLGMEPLPLAIIVVQQGRSLPGAGAIKWRLKANNLTANAPSEVIQALFKREQELIFGFSRWNEILAKRGLAPYMPEKTAISEITKQLIQRFHGGLGESEAHQRFKRYISLNPKSVKLPSGCLLVDTEFTFPSMDRADVLFESEGYLYPVEVKARDADQIEITRGIYQVVKYDALARAFQKDRGLAPNASACLALEGNMSEESRARCHLLGVRFVENIVIPSDFEHTQ